MRVEPPSTVSKTPHGRRETARKILAAVQGGVCAMCSISYYNWRARDTGTCPILGPPDHLDHDHHTGLIRRLLCTRCNTSREPVGAVARNDTWQVYAHRTSAAELGCSWQWS